MCFSFTKITSRQLITVFRTKGAYLTYELGTPLFFLWWKECKGDFLPKDFL